MHIFRALSVFVVVFSLVMATSTAFSSACACNHASSQEGMDCHKQMAKQEKKSCCCDKALGCKISFNLLSGSEPLVFLSGTASYYLSQAYAHSLHLVPAAQPPKA
jgi:hypothetical protein